MLFRYTIWGKCTWWLLGYRHFRIFRVKRRKKYRRNIYRRYWTGIAGDNFKKCTKEDCKSGRAASVTSWSYWYGILLLQVSTVKTFNKVGFSKNVRLKIKTFLFNKCVKKLGIHPIFHLVCPNLRTRAGEYICI